METPIFALYSRETLHKRLDYEIQFSPENGAVPLLEDLFWRLVWEAKVENDPELHIHYLTDMDMYEVKYKNRWFYACTT